jgi:hypothetical protein
MAAVLAGDVFGLLTYEATSPLTVAEATARFRRHDALAALPSGAAGQAGTPGSAQDTGRPAATSAPSTTAAVHHAPTARPGAAIPAHAAPQPEAVGAPADGVYVYATTGQEATDPGVLPAQTHDYPAQTTLTYVRRACGGDYRWDALKERFDAWSVCTGPTGRRLVSMTEHFEFYNHTDEQTYYCTSDSIDVPANAAAGTRYRARCGSDGDNQTPASGFTITGNVVGMEVLAVGDRQVPTLHLEETLTADGGTTGTGRRSRWVVAQTGLPVRTHSTSKMQSDSSVGTVHYSEEYTLALTSLDPRT